MPSKKLNYIYVSTCINNDPKRNQQMGTGPMWALKIRKTPKCPVPGNSAGDLFGMVK